MGYFVALLLCILLQSFSLFLLMLCQKYLIPLHIQLRYPDQSPLSPSRYLVPKRSLHPALVRVCSSMLTFELFGG